MSKIIFFMSIFYSISVFAQDIGLDTSFGDDGVQIKHAPSNFKAKLRFRVQGRATYTDNDDVSPKPDKTGFEIRRTRLSMEGTVLDPRLFYKLQFSFSRGDMDWDTFNYPNILRDAMVGWKLTDNNSILFGQGKLPGNRQRVISSSQQELVDRSLLNSTFTIDRDLGIQSWNQFGDDMPLWIKLAVTNGEGRASENSDMGLATTVRVEWLPLGVLKNNGDYFEGDVEFEESPKLSLGAVYSKNKRTHRVGGQIGSYIHASDSRDLEAYFADVLFKYQGFAFSSEFAQRKADNPILNPDQYILVGQAVTAQASYMFPSYYSPVLRWTKLWPEEQIYSESNIRTQYTAGLTKYFNKHKVKLQGDITYEDVDMPYTQTSETNWIARLQFEVGI